MKAYPHISKTENLMRKLITKFMLKNLGKAWIELSAPKEVRDEIGRTKRTGSDSDPLHNVDFSSLTEYLLKPYASEPQESIHKIIKTIDPADAAGIANQLEQLKSLIPQSNWSRYFSKIVDCEDSYLKKQWAALYALRCKVAHNTFLDAHEFSDVIELCNELNSIIGKAIERLSQVEVKGLVELEELATAASESTRSSMSQDDDAEMPGMLHGSLNFMMRMVLSRMHRLAAENNVDIEPNESISNISRKLLLAGLLDVTEKRLIDTALDVSTGGYGQVTYPASTERGIAKSLAHLIIQFEHKKSSPASE